MRKPTLKTGSLCKGVFLRTTHPGVEGTDVVKPAHGPPRIWGDKVAEGTQRKQEPFSACVAFWALCTVTVLLHFFSTRIWDSKVGKRDHGAVRSGVLLVFPWRYFLPSPIFSPLSKTFMSFLDLPFALCATAALVLMIHYVCRRPIRSNLPLPPGPKKLPFIGNIFDVPPASAWETYTEWGRKFVVLLSSTATDDLLEKRSAIYSDRPSLPMYVVIIGWDFNFGKRAGPFWRAHRRLFSQEFNSVGSKRIRPKQLAAARRMLGRFVATPGKFSEHMRQMAGELIINVAYGIDVLPVDDPYIALADEGVQAGTDATIPGKFLVTSQSPQDAFPILRYVPDWFPGAGFKRQAKEWRKVAHALRDVPFAECKRLAESGTAPQSFTSECLQHLNGSGPAYYDEDTIKGTAATIFILAMLANPAAQKKAQMEIDSVTGGTRLPDFDDEEALPYTSAIVKEIFRWQPVAPIGLHLCPFGFSSLKILCTHPPLFASGELYCYWEYLDMYPDPYAFKPERFCSTESLIYTSETHRLPSALDEVASILSSFDITKAIGDDGGPVEPTYEYSTGLARAPLPFKCTIRPRSQGAIAVIEAGISEYQAKA
ncbi:cytochrome P450 [Mycena alexandri]|uniref:Cytochrome P450 n=1 Tax=Mycena alexandri TaxID=1745969 RepID=A0AAD6SSD6_9AGAR|nr:cytochrome P450 [Mycena alexandri]